MIDQILARGAGVLENDYDMVYFPGDDLFAVNRPRGLPIGNLTSQFWANVILDPIDHFRLKQRNGMRFRRRLRGLARAVELQEISPKTLAASLQGWENHVRYGNTTGLRRAILADLPRERALSHWTLSKETSHGPQAAG